MKTGKLQIRKLIFGGFAVFAAFGLWACIYGGGGDGGSDGLALFVTDTTDIDTLKFDDVTKDLYSNSGTFDLDKIRKKVKDKDINLDSLQITDLAVTYDIGTVSFLAANIGKHFVLSILYHTDAAGDTDKIALETKSTTGVLAFNPDSALFQLNKNIFANAAGFAKLVNAVKDTTAANIVHTATVTAQLSLQDSPPLAAEGRLVLHFVVTVGGKKN